MTCSVDGCPKPVEKSGLCAGHRKRKARGVPVDEPLRTYGDKWASLMTAVRAYAEEEQDAGFDNRAKGGRSRVEERISKAALRYAEWVRRKAARQSAPRQCPPVD